MKGLRQIFSGKISMRRTIIPLSAGVCGCQQPLWVSDALCASIQNYLT